MLDKAGVRLKLSKCVFGVREISILGHIVNQEGLQPSAGHVAAIRALVEPASGEELMRFLGLVNYFASFVDHFSEAAKPLYDVLKARPFRRNAGEGKSVTSTRLHTFYHTVIPSLSNLVHFI